MLEEKTGRYFAAKRRGESRKIIDYDGGLEKGYIRVRRKIMQEGKEIGTLGAYLTKPFLTENLFRLFLFVASIVMFLASTIFVISNILLIKILVNPLEALTDSANAISKGELNQLIEIKSHDEIGSLAEAFKRKQFSLRISMTRLKASKKTAIHAKARGGGSTSEGSINKFIQQVRANDRLPSLETIFKTCSRQKIAPNELIAVAWKEWQNTRA